MAAFDVVVVGGGIAGLAAALEASIRGFTVALVEAGGVASGATGAAAGIVSLQMPDPYQSWALESLRLYTRALAARPIGAVLVAGEECVEATRRILSRRGPPSRVVGEDEASELLGAPVRVWRGASILYSTEYVVDVGAAVAYIRRALEEAGGVVAEWCRASIEGPAARCAKETYRARTALVVAAGAWTPSLLGLRPRDLAGSRVYRCEAFSATLPLAMILYVEHGGSAAYALPETGVKSIAGDGPNTATDDPETASVPDPATPYQVLETLSKATPAALTAYPTAHWAAPCILPGDGRPLLGLYERRSGVGVYVFAGLNGHGLMTAPALARLLLDYIEGKSRGDPNMNPKRASEPWNTRPPEPYAACA